MTGEGRPRRAAALLIIVAAAGFLYAPTIHDYFLQDDFGVVGLFSQRSIAYFPRWFVTPWTEDVWGYVPDEIRPFPALSYTVTAWFGAAAPAPNHILNIALHAFNAVLVMWIAETAAGLSLVPAAAAGLVFAVLPIQAESVAWITGRVDSLPACFYFVSFLLFVRWRRSGRVVTYVWSLVLFFAALFSKQNTITLAPALVLFDLIVPERKGPPDTRFTWHWIRPYVPYAILTAAFLMLRFVLFHEVARESVLSAQRVREFVSDSSRHLVRLVFGGPGIRHWTARDDAIVALVAAAAALGARRSKAGRYWRPAIYFGVIWIALGTAPILVSGYYSPRHMYLASLGWAVILGAGFEIAWQSQPVRAGRTVAALVILATLAAYSWQLRGVVRDWHHRAEISAAAVSAIAREAASQPEGTLIIAGVPESSWAFAIPHSLKPPFTNADVAARLLVISDSADHCCDAVHWSEYTRQALRAWQSRADRPPVIALYWDERTARLSRISDQDDPQLRTVVSLLMRTDSRETLDSQIRGLLNNYVALR